MIFIMVRVTTVNDDVDNCNNILCRKFKEKNSTKKSSTK